MRHVSDGTLRARADHELEEPEASAVERHLHSCQKCSARAADIAARAGEFQSIFGSEPAGLEADPRPGFRRLEARRRERETGTPMLLVIFGPRVRSAMAALTAVVLLAAWAPARLAARKLLGVFRAKNVVVVPLERDFLANGKGKLISDLLADTVVITRDEKARAVANRDEASEWVGFRVRLPASRPEPPRILRVEGARTFHFTVDQKRVEALMDLVRQPGLQLPPGLAGAQVQVEIGRAARIVYGDCPDTASAQADPSRLVDCLELMESPAVTVTTQPEQDLRQIAEIGLRVSGMTAAAGGDLQPHHRLDVDRGHSPAARIVQLSICTSGRVARRPGDGPDDR